MIDELHVRDVALIRDATIEPAAGLTVLTGETGAGKTALLSSIKLLVGERSDAGMVREGSASLEVEGRLFLRGDDEDGTVVRRRVSADGRGRVELDGHMASVRELSERVGSTVDLCGQHEHQRLLAVATHAEMLDTWAGAPAAEALDVYRDALAAAEEAAAELERVREMGRATGERLDEAAFVLRRIDEVDPREGELEELEAQLPRVEHGEALMSAALGARERLAADDGACDALGEAVRALTDAARFDEKLGGWAATLESALLEIEDVASELRGYADEVDFDPEELDRVQADAVQAVGGLRPFTWQQWIEAYERVYGLPGPCAKAGQLWQERLALLAVALQERGGISLAWLKRYAALAGYEVDISEYRPFRAGHSHAGDALTNGDWIHAFLVVAEAGARRAFRAGQSVAGEALRTWGDSLLECIVNWRKPAHTVALVAYREA